MEIIPCGKGHFYNKNLGECPQCAAERAAAAGKGGNAGFAMDYGKTMPSGNGGTTMPSTDSVLTRDSDTIPPTSSVVPNGKGGNYNQETEPSNKKIEDYGPTHIAGMGESQFDPIVGWLVCVQGPDRGRDYRLHAGNNRVGRNPHNDILIQGDNTISAESNCSIAFDPASGCYYFVPGDGRNMLYLNDKVIFNPGELHAYDTITVGSTKLLFVPLCGEHFSWND